MHFLTAHPVRHQTTAPPVVSKAGGCLIGVLFKEPGLCRWYLFVSAIAFPFFVTIQVVIHFLLL